MKVLSSLDAVFFHQAETHSGVHILRVAHERWGQGSQTTDRKLPRWTLGLVLSGCLKLHALGRQVGEGYLYSFAPGTSRLVTVEQGPVELMLCGFTTQDPSCIPAALCRQEPFRVQDPERVRRCFRDLVEESQPGDALAHQAAVHRLHLLLLAAQREAPSEQDEARARAHFAVAQSILSMGWAHQRSVEEVAAQCGISHAWLCRLFQRYAGCTPRQYIMQQRIRAACDMLWREEQGIAKIAERVGFADQFTFSKAFKRVTGLAPSTWLAHMRREK